MMNRFLIPSIAFILFYLEPIVSLFSPVELGGGSYIFVPRLLIVFLIFIASYYSRQRAIFYGFLFGLLYDMYHIDIIGLYTFMYPLICYISSIIIRQIERQTLSVMLLSLGMIILLELLSYLFASIIALTSIGFGEFFTARLVPTIIVNSLFIGMFGWVFKVVTVRRFTQKRVSF